MDLEKKVETLPTSEKGSDITYLMIELFTKRNQLGYKSNKNVEKTISI